MTALLWDLPLVHPWLLPVKHRRMEIREPRPDSLTDDRRLAIAAQGGDRSAFGQLVERHKVQVWALCHRYLGPSDAADAAQETFLRAHQGLASFDPNLDFRPWLLRIARNHCLDELRRRGRRPESSTTDDAGALAALPDPALSADQTVAAQQEHDRLRNALALLPERHREAVLLFHEAQLSYVEIAKVLGVPIGTVMTWIYRARRELRAHLEAAS